MLFSLLCILKIFTFYVLSTNYLYCIWRCLRVLATGADRPLFSLYVYIKLRFCSSLQPPARTAKTPAQRPKVLWMKTKSEVSADNMISIKVHKDSACSLEPNLPIQQNTFSGRYELLGNTKYLQLQSKKSKLKYTLNKYWYLCVVSFRGAKPKHDHTCFLLSPVCVLTL